MNGIFDAFAKVLQIVFMHTFSRGAEPPDGVSLKVTKPLNQLNRRRFDMDSARSLFMAHLFHIANINNWKATDESLP
ncbi:hypothetical protein ACK85N_004900, partial [Salmonella enterica]